VCEIAKTLEKLFDDSTFDVCGKRRFFVVLSCTKRKHNKKKGKPGKRQFFKPKNVKRIRVIRVMINGK
jgi:hypothetical protein